MVPVVPVETDMGPLPNPPGPLGLPDPLEPLALLGPLDDPLRLGWFSSPSADPFAAVDDPPIER